MNARSPVNCRSILPLLIAMLIGMPLFAGKRTSLQQFEDKLRKAGSTTQKVDGLVKLAQQYAYYWKFDKADSTAKMIAEISSKLHYNVGNAHYHYASGLVLRGNYKFSESISEFRKAARGYKSLHSKCLDRCYLEIGNTFLRWGKFADAFKYFTLSLDLSEKHKHIDVQALCHMQIAILFNQIDSWRGSYLKVSTHARKALELAEKTKDAQLQAAVYRTYSNAFAGDLNVNFFHKQQKKALAIYEAENDTFHLALLAIDRGANYRLEHKFESALSELRSALKVWQKTPVKDQLANSYRQLAHVHMELRNGDSAVYFYQKAVVLSKQIGNLVELARDYYWLAESDSLAGNYTSAFRHLYKSENIYSQAQFDKNTAQVRAYNANYESDKRQARMIDLDFRQRQGAQNLQQQTTYIYILAGGILMLVSITVLIYLQLRNRQKNRLIIAERDRVLEEQKALNYRLQALSAQMNPHFIFNALTSIQRYLLSNDIDNSNRYLSDFSRLMRQTLENSQETAVSLTDELEMLETYLKLEQMRVSNKFDYTITVDKAIDPNNTYIPTLLIQPYTENAIWHGLGDDKMLLQIHLHQSNELICCSIDDNGVGRPKDVIQKTRKSYGMSITKTRLELINILEDGQINVRVTDKTDKEGQSLGTRVDICFPADL